MISAPTPTPLLLSRCYTEVDALVLITFPENYLDISDLNGIKREIEANTRTHCGIYAQDGVLGYLVQKEQAFTVYDYLEYFFDTKLQTEVVWR